MTLECFLSDKYNCGIQCPQLSGLKFYADGKSSGRFLFGLWISVSECRSLVAVAPDCTEKAMHGVAG